MSSSDSGVIILAMPVILTVGAVTMAGVAISAAAEKYKRLRQDQTSAEELRRKLELDQITYLAETNQREYDKELAGRAAEERSRREKEELARDAAQAQMREELLAEAGIRQEIENKIHQMDLAIKAYEAEFGESAQLREMAGTLHHSEQLFGDSVQLVQELDDMIFQIIPGMSEEQRKEHHSKQVQGMFAEIAYRNKRVDDTSEEFVSLYRGDRKKKQTVGKTPWESFTARLKAVSAVEEAYFESEAAELMEEAEAVTVARRNFFIQQHEQQLMEMEERAAEYQGQQRTLSDKVMNDFFLYLAMARKLGIEPGFTEEDLTDEYTLTSMREETDILIERYKKSRERQYTVNAFTAVMKRHNLVFESVTVADDGYTDIEYSMDRQTCIHINRSDSGAFEMQFQGKSMGETVSIDERRAITEKAKRFCTLLPEIVEELDKEFGITFGQTALQPPSTENIEICSAAGSTRRERARAAKTMKMK